MALFKTITTKNGITITYHKIKSVEIFNKLSAKLKVKVDSYADDSYRKIEKAYEQAMTDYQSYTKQIDEILLLQEEERDTDQIIKLTNSSNEAVAVMSELINTEEEPLAIFSTEHEFDSENATLESVYELLKTTEMFLDATDI